MSQLSKGELETAMLEMQIARASGDNAKSAAWVFRYGEDVMGHLIKLVSIAAARSDLLDDIDEALKSADAALSQISELDEE